MEFPGCDALRGVDLSVRQGSVFALLGENGAGKTTLIRILTGYQKPTSGDCRVCGLDPLRDGLAIRRRIGYVSDAPALYDWMTVAEIGWFAASFYPAGFLEAYRRHIAAYEVPESRKIKVLSKGQRAKVALSLAIAHDPELLILDEPTSGLDPLVRREFLESMVDRASAGRTVFLSSHQITEVERVADTVAILHEGRVRFGGELSTLKQSVTELTVLVDDPLATLPTLPASATVLSEQTEGRQRRTIVQGFTEGMREELKRYRGVLGVRERSASLEDLFVACTRGSRQRTSELPSVDFPHRAESNNELETPMASR
jgi:ABC-2 type transport system ATP-binding protein